VTCDVSQLWRHRASKQVIYISSWSIHSCFHWCKNYENWSRNAKLIVEKLLASFFPGHGVLSSRQSCCIDTCVGISFCDSLPEIIKYISNPATPDYVIQKYIGTRNTLGHFVQMIRPNCRISHNFHEIFKLTTSVWSYLVYYLKLQDNLQDNLQAWLKTKDNLNSSVWSQLRNAKLQALGPDFQNILRWYT